MSIKFSIIVPVYNTEKYVKKCLDSIITQNYHNFELIVVDDGSTDQSPQIIDEYNKYDNVKIIHKENGGVSSARNKGIEIASGDYITFVDSDDYVKEDFLIFAYEDIIFNGGIENVDICIFNIESNLLDIHQDTFKVENKNELIDTLISYDYGVKKYNKYGWRSVLHGSFYKKSIIGEVRFFINQKLSEDEIFILNVINKSNNIFINQKKIYYYFIHEHSASYPYNYGFFKEYVKTYNNFINVIDSNNNKEALIYRLLHNFYFSIFPENIVLNQSFFSRYKITKKIVRDTFKFKDFIPPNPKKYTNSIKELIIFYLAKYNCVLLIVIFMQLLKFKNFCKKMLKNIFK